MKKVTLSLFILGFVFTFAATKVSAYQYINGNVVWDSVEDATNHISNSDPNNPKARNCLGYVIEAPTFLGRTSEPICYSLKVNVTRGTSNTTTCFEAAEAPGQCGIKVNTNQSLSSATSNSAVSIPQYKLFGSLNKLAKNYGETCGDDTVCRGNMFQCLVDAQDKSTSPGIIHDQFYDVDQLPTCTARVGNARRASLLAQAKARDDQQAAAILEDDLVVAGDLNSAPTECSDAVCPTGFKGTCSSHDKHDGNGCICEMPEGTCTPIPPATCNNNGIKDNGETGIDCGGGACHACAPAAAADTPPVQTQEQVLPKAPFVPPANPVSQVAQTITNVVNPPPKTKNTLIGLVIKKLNRSYIIYNVNDPSSANGVDLNFQAGENRIFQLFAVISKGVGSCPFTEENGVFRKINPNSDCGEVALRTIDFTNTAGAESTTPTQPAGGGESTVQTPPDQCTCDSNDPAAVPYCTFQTYHNSCGAVCPGSKDCSTSQTGGGTTTPVPAAPTCTEGQERAEDIGNGCANFYKCINGTEVYEGKDLIDPNGSCNE